jgi:glycerophosphoryl diester phosphodiesterase
MRAARSTGIATEIMVRIPELIAHRGYPRRYPENTLPGIEAALKTGARYVEIDVQTTADHVPVLFHDATLERLCGVPGAVRDYRFADLCELRAHDPTRFGNAFAEIEIPTLGAVETLFQDWPRATLFVEIKREALVHSGIDEVYWRVAAALASLPGRAVLISFERDFLLAARWHGWPLLGGVVERWAERDRPQWIDIAPQYLFADIDHLPEAGALGWRDARLAVYEVADAALALSLAARGVDLIETFAVGEMLTALGTRPHANPTSCLKRIATMSS